MKYDRVAAGKGDGSTTWSAVVTVKGKAGRVYTCGTACSCDWCLHGAPGSDGTFTENACAHASHVGPYTERVLSITGGGVVEDEPEQEVALDGALTYLRECKVGEIVALEVHDRVFEEENAYWLLFLTREPYMLAARAMDSMSTPNTLPTNTWVVEGHFLEQVPGTAASARQHYVVGDIAVMSALSEETSRVVMRAPPLIDVSGKRAIKTKMAADVFGSDETDVWHPLPLPDSKQWEVGRGTHELLCAKLDKSPDVYTR